MHESQWLAERFEADRTRLRLVAYRMLGSLSEAEDAVQEAWLRLSRSGAAEVENLGGWMTTVVARACLDMLRTRRSRREAAFADHAPEPVAAGQAGHGRRSSRSGLGARRPRSSSRWRATGSRASTWSPIPPTSRSWRSRSSKADRAIRCSGLVHSGMAKGRITVTVDRHLVDQLHQLGGAKAAVGARQRGAGGACGPAWAPCRTQGAA